MVMALPYCALITVSRNVQITFLVQRCGVHVEKRDIIYTVLQFALNIFDSAVTALL